MRVVLALLFLVFFISPTSAQYRPLRSFIPPGYRILGRASADINGDGHIDQVIVFKNPYEKIYWDTTRPLLVFAGNGKGGYRLLARNDSAVLCAGCGGVHGDPYQKVTAVPGWFSIKHFGGSGWRWTRVITFAYDHRRKQLLLRSDGGWSWHVRNSKDRTRLANQQQDFGQERFDHFSFNRAFEGK